MTTLVTKRSGRLEPLMIDKIHKVITWAAEGLRKVSVSQVELQAQLLFVDCMKTEDIHATITKTAADLISTEAPDYQYLAGKLAMFHLRKKVHGNFEPPKLSTFVRSMVERNHYDEELTSRFTDEEFDIMDKAIDHSRDMLFSYASFQQLAGKYLVQNRVTGDIFETPQFLYMMVAASLFGLEPNKEKRLEKIIKFYDSTSTHKISLPTPIMAGVRTPTRQFSSCVLIEADDSLDSINAASSSIVKYVSQRAGIGLNVGRIRALGSAIRGGEALHTGCVPFYKHFQTAVKSCSQGGVRGGAATLFYPLWHLEVENLLVLKNNRGTDENRVRHLDYAVQFCSLLYKRLRTNDLITLFSPSDVPGLYDAFFEDQEKFEELYLKYEADDSIRKKKVKAITLFSLFAQERSSTGRIYLQNVDHTNKNSPFNAKKAPIRQSNLCLEIALPTKPLTHSRDEEGEIALCTLSAFNLGAINSFDELEELSEIIVEALDNLLDYQDYPVIAAEVSTKKRRTLGIGVINYAYDLARKGFKYSDGSANQYTHELFEAMQYYLLKASNKLAKERGACPGFDETTYSEGVMPIDRYHKGLDKFANFPLKMDWDALRNQILESGLRNSTLTALMPSETSSQISNATNGIEPPRGHVSIKSSKDGYFKQVVPEYERLKGQYELVWDMPDNDGYLTLVGIMQKFVDQTISANTNYDPSKFENDKVPLKVILKDILSAYVKGVKTLYYHNTRDGNSEVNPEADKKQSAKIDAPVVVVEEDDSDCEGGSCKI